MDIGIDPAQMVPFDRVFLDQQNPRHSPFDGQDAVIEYLCKNESVLALARDIARIGLNPLELFALLPVGDNAFVSAEGNRRLCALMLLNDPERAPRDLRKGFAKAAESWEPIDQLHAVIFPSREAVRVWLDRIHAGFQEGRGRRQWDAEQKARNSGYAKNVPAQVILDIGEELGFITPAQRRGRISTVERYLSNPVMRDALGLEFDDAKNPTCDLSEADFSLALKRFMGDVAAKGVTTRDNAATIRGYAHKLRKLEGFTDERIAPRPLTDLAAAEGGEETGGSRQSKPRTKIPRSDDLRDALEDLSSYKLERMYHSLCSIGFRNHAPLLCVGAWAFLETLTALAGRTRSTSFADYLSSQRLTNLGITARGDRKSIGEAIKRISEFGNSTKHHKTAAVRKPLKVATCSM